jgi:hypothetical protein
MGAGAVIGALLGYGITALLWKNVARIRRVRFCRILIGIAVVWLLAIFGEVAVINPEIATTRSFVERLRDFLVAPSYGANILIFLLGGCLTYCVVAALVILSPKLDAH